MAATSRSAALAALANRNKQVRAPEASNAKPQWQGSDPDPWVRQPDAPAAQPVRQAAKPPPRPQWQGSEPDPWTKPPGGGAPPPQHQAAPQRAPAAPPPQKAPAAPPPQRSNPGPVSPSAAAYLNGSVPPGAEAAESSNMRMCDCPTCGRSFNEKAFQRHVKVCEKVFVKKRKVFNVVAARVEGTEAAKFIDVKAGKPKAGTVAAKIEKEQTASKAKKAKWKSQSDQLRQAMNAQRMIVQAKAEGKDIRSLNFGPSQEDDDRVPCPHCGRKFAALTAERHIPHCANTAAKPSRQMGHSNRGAYARH